MDPKDYPHPQYWALESDGDFKDLLGSIILRAPDNFYNSSLSPEWQLTLDVAFDILRAGTDLYCRKRKRLKDQQARLNSILDVALAAYQAGDRQTGMDEVYRFEVAIFGHIEFGKRTYEYFPELDVYPDEDMTRLDQTDPSHLPATSVEIAGLGEIANFKDAFEAAKAKFGPDGKGGD